MLFRSRGRRSAAPERGSGAPSRPSCVLSSFSSGGLQTVIASAAALPVQVLAGTAASAAIIPAPGQNVKSSLHFARFCGPENPFSDGCCRIRISKAGNHPWMDGCPIDSGLPSETCFIVQGIYRKAHKARCLLLQIPFFVPWPKAVFLHPRI